MTRDEELASLNARLAASERMGPGYAARITAIKEAISKLEESGNAGGS